MRSPFTCEIPMRMRTLPRDRRGYPVPFVVLVDDAGRPHFTVNDVRRSAKAARSRLCHICGKRVTDGAFWFVGGPGSALLPQGRYIDGPSHEECARFAIRVCPYLAAPSYGRRIDTATIDPAAVPDTLVMFDPTMDAARPSLFCLTRSSGYEMTPGDGQAPYFSPVRPWVVLEYWRHGRQMPDEEAAPIAAEHVRALLERQLA